MSVAFHSCLVVSTFRSKATQPFFLTHTTHLQSFLFPHIDNHRRWRKCTKNFRDDFLCPVGNSSLESATTACSILWTAFRIQNFDGFSYDFVSSRTFFGSLSETHSLTLHFEIHFEDLFRYFERPPENESEGRHRTNIINHDCFGQLRFPGAAASMASRCLGVSPGHSDRIFTVEQLTEVVKTFRYQQQDAPGSEFVIFTQSGGLGPARAAVLRR